MDFSSVYGGGGDEGLEEEDEQGAGNPLPSVFTAAQDGAVTRRAASLVEALRISGFANDAVVELALQRKSGASMDAAGLDLVETMLKRCRAFADACESSNCELERERGESERLRSLLERARAHAGRLADDVSRMITRTQHARTRAYALRALA